MDFLNVQYFSETTLQAITSCVYTHVFMRFHVSCSMSFTYHFMRFHVLFRAFSRLFFSEFSRAVRLRIFLSAFPPRVPIFSFSSSHCQAGFSQAVRGSPFGGPAPQARCTYTRNTRESVRARVRLTEGEDAGEGEGEGEGESEGERV